MYAGQLYPFVTDRHETRREGPLITRSSRYNFLGVDFISMPTKARTNPAQGFHKAHMHFSNFQLFATCVLIWGSTWIAITFQLGQVAP